MNIRLWPGALLAIGLLACSNQLYAASGGGGFAGGHGGGGSAAGSHGGFAGHSFNGGHYYGRGYPSGWHSNNGRYTGWANNGRYRGWYGRNGRYYRYYGRRGYYGGYYWYPWWPGFAVGVYGFGYPYYDDYPYDYAYPSSGGYYGSDASDYPLAGGNVGQAVQQALAARGYYKGRIDGVIGDETSDAIRSFQRSQGFHVSGGLDEQTLRALQIR